MGEDEEDAVPLAHAAGRARTRGEGALVEAVLTRGDTIATWLASGLTPRQAMRRATKPPPVGLGLPRSTAQRYVAYTLRALASDAMQEPLESKRARIIAAAHSALQAAAAKTRKVYDQGDVVAEEQDPDTRSMIAALDLIAKLEGLAPK